MEPDFKPDSTGKKRSSRKMLWMRYAALFILPLLVGGIVYLSWDSTREVKSEKTSSRIVPGASMAELVLPDRYESDVGSGKEQGFGRGQ